MGNFNFKKCLQFLVFMTICAVPTCWGVTNPPDVYALNSLYAALGYPPLPGWLPIGGDPCGLGWQGVQCVNANITGIVLNGANLGGQLSEDMNLFSSIIQIDLSNNHIGGTIPSNLPLTMRSFFLSGNQFTGSIPDTIASLGQLSDLFLNNNHLTGIIPDAFQQLKSLINMDLSENNMNGQLPSSMGNLSSLTTLLLQNNQLSGTLDVLEDLPLINLNIENNLFSGPIPDKLLNVPNFRKDGNPFNTTVLPSPPASSPKPSPTVGFPPELSPENQATEPSVTNLVPHTGRGNSVKTSKGITWLAVAGLLAIVVLALVMCFLLFRCCKRRQFSKKITKRQEMYAYGSPRTNAGHMDSLQKPSDQAEKATKDAIMSLPVGNVNGNGRNNTSMSLEGKQETDGKYKSGFIKQRDHSIDMTGVDHSIRAPPPPPFPLLSSEKSIPDPILPLMTMSSLSSSEISMRLPSERAGNSLNALTLFSIASLQQYTDSFSHENLIGKGMLGTVYKAELPDGKLLAVKKIDNMSSRHQNIQEFLEHVANLSKLQHANIVKLVGYCTEHGQQILVYEYFENGTLHEALHLDDEIHRRLSWNTRLHLALQAAKALEYLHEVCQPPVIHQNFKSANILLDGKLNIHVSDCGLAPFLSSNSMAQHQVSGYGAPELELGSYTHQSDVYSFGVVMLELLTGRKSHDSLRPRAEQYLVRWAIHRLHDIDALSRMVDPSLNGSYTSKSLSRFADIISLCIQAEPEFRPPMSEIVECLSHMGYNYHKV